MAEAVSTACQWCDEPFRARRGGSPQRFCGARCRSAFWTALRRWGERAVAAGILTIDDIRSGDPAACTLLPGHVSLAPVGEMPAQCLGPAVPCADSRFTRQEDFETLLARTIAARRR
jgi:hypothetical protein